MKVFLGRIIIGIGDAYHEVHLLTKGKKLEIEKAYIVNDFVYIYRGTISNPDNVCEGYLYTYDNKVIIGEIHTPEMMKMHSVNNIIELNLDNIFEDIKRNADNFNTAEMIEAVNNNAELFIPTINPDDDFLKYLIKKVIIDKKINLKNYKDKFASQNDLNNMKSGLTHKTKMSVVYFMKWLEILGLQCKIELSDNGTDKLAPLHEPIYLDTDEVRSDEYGTNL